MGLILWGMHAQLSSGGVINPQTNRGLAANFKFMCLYEKYRLIWKITYGPIRPISKDFNGSHNHPEEDSLCIPSMYRYPGI